MQSSERPSAALWTDTGPLSPRRNAAAGTAHTRMTATGPEALDSTAESGRGILRNGEEFRIMREGEEQVGKFA